MMKIKTTNKNIKKLTNMCFKNNLRDYRKKSHKANQMYNYGMIR